MDTTSPTAQQAETLTILSQQSERSHPSSSPSGLLCTLSQNPSYPTGSRAFSDAATLLVFPEISALTPSPQPRPAALQRPIGCRGATGHRQVNQCSAVETACLVDV